VKSVLVILTHSNLNSLQVHESLSAAMVLATFGSQVKILLQGAALSLLRTDLEFSSLQHAFKVASGMVESFEFYDLTPVYIESKDRLSPFVSQSQQEIEFIEFNHDFIQQFDHVLYW
jgi:hypothetical protein